MSWAKYIELLSSAKPFPEAPEGAPAMLSALAVRITEGNAEVRLLVTF
jgi:hypothetical protein